MKTRFFLGVSALLLSIAPFGLMGQSRLTVDTNELPPYVSMNRENSFLTDLLDEIAREMGMRFEYNFLPWTRCESEVGQGKAWAAMPYVKTEERSKRFKFSDSLFDRRTLFFYYSRSGKPKDIDFDKLSDIRQYRVGAVKGYYYEEQFKNVGLSVEYVNTEEQNFLKLRSERVDLIPAEEILGWTVIESLFGREERKRFFTLDKPLTVGSIYLMSSKDYPDGDLILGKFNKALLAIKKNGIYSALVEKHGLYPPKEPIRAKP